MDSFALVGRLSVVAALGAPMSARAEVSPPCVLHPEPPTYPEVAGKARVGGALLVEVSVAPDGRVSKATVIDGHPLLDFAVEEAALRWRFDPSPESNEERSLVLSFTFKTKFEDSSSTRTETAFTPPSSLEISYVRGTILPLECGYPERCPVHGTPLERGVVPISNGFSGGSTPADYYGLPLVVNGDTLLFLEPEKTIESIYPELEQTDLYREACRKKFPFALHGVSGGCTRGVEDRTEVMFCPACRVEEEKWAKKHPKASRVAPGLFGGDRRLSDLF